MRNRIVNNKSLITEGVETKNMSAAKHYLYDNYNYSESKALEVIGAVKHDIPNVRLQKCKFILGVTRMYCTKQLTDSEVIRKLNRTLRLVASNTHVNEYDQNLNGMSADELIEKFALAVQKDLDDTKDELLKMEFVENASYKIVPINSFDDAYEYHMWTDWCVANDESAYNTYTSGGINKFYFCLADGFEDVEEERGEHCPLDEYGLSMIAVSVSEHGGLNTATCRWNHANGGNDNIMNEVQISELLGVNFFSVFKPWSPEELAERKKALLSEISREISELDEYEWSQVMTSRYCEIIMPKKSADIRDNALNGNYDDFDEDDEDEYSWSEDYDDFEFIHDNAYGYIVSTDCNETLCEIGGDDKYIIVDYKFDPMGDTLYDNAYIMDNDFDNEKDVYILVTLGKKFNVFNFGKEEYVFSEWQEFAPHIISDGDGNFYFIVDFVGFMQFFTSDGKPFGPKCDDIKIYCRSCTAFVTINKVTHYMNWLTGDIYIKDIVRHNRVMELESIMTKDEKSYLYGPNDEKAGFNKRLVKLSNVELVALGALNGFRTIPGIQGHGYAITGKGVGPCVVDTKKRITYNKDGEIIDRCTEDY